MTEFNWAIVIAYLVNLMIILGTLSALAAILVLVVRRLGIRKNSQP